MPTHHGLRPDQGQVASPVFVQAPDEKSEELVPSPEAWPTLSAKGDLKLLAEEQVLDHRQLVQMRAPHVGQTPR